MNRIKNLIAICAFSFLVLCLPAIASAQYGGQNYPGGRNGGYGNYGDIRSTLRDLKDRSKDFKKEIDRQNGGGGIFGGYSNRNGDRYLRDLADQFKSATSRLEGNYRDGRDQYKSQSDAQRVLDLGSQLEQEMYRGRSDRYMQNDWSRISSDLRVVADTYGFNNRNNRNNRNNGGYYPNNGNYPNGNYPNGNYPNGNYPNNNNRYPQGGYRPSWWPF